MVEVIRPSDLQSATKSSSINGSDCFENYLRRKVFQKALEGSSALLSGIYRLDMHGGQSKIDCEI